MPLLIAGRPDEHESPNFKFKGTQCMVRHPLSSQLGERFKSVWCVWLDRTASICSAFPSLKMYFFLPWLGHIAYRRVCICLWVFCSMSEVLPEHNFTGNSIALNQLVKCSRIVWGPCVANELWKIMGSRPAYAAGSDWYDAFLMIAVLLYRKQPLQTS